MDYTDPNATNPRMFAGGSPSFIEGSGSPFVNGSGAWGSPAPSRGGYLSGGYPEASAPSPRMFAGGAYRQGPYLMGTQLVSQNAPTPFSDAETAQRIAFMRDQGMSGGNDNLRSPGAAMWRFGDQGHLTTPQVRNLMPSLHDNDTIPMLLSVIGAGLGAGAFGGTGAAGASEGAGATGAGATGATEGAGVGDIFGGGWSSDPAAWQAGTGAGGAAGAAGGAASAGGASSGFPSSLIGPAINAGRQLLGGGQSGAPQGGAQGPGIGGLLGAGLGLAGSNQANLAYEEAQRRAQDAGQFTPYNIFSGVGSTTSGPGGITSTLSPQYQGLRDQYLGNAAGQSQAAGTFDPYQAANTFYGQMQGQAAPYEAQQRADALAQLQGMGQVGLGVGPEGANPLYSSLLKAQADAARQRQISSYGMSQDIANQMQQRALGWGGAGLGLDQAQLAQQQLGGYLGGLSSNAALGGARLAQGPIMARGLTRGGMLSGAGGSLMSGGLPSWLRGLVGGGQGWGQGGDPTQYIEQPGGGGFTAGGGQFNDFTGGWDSAPVADASQDWTSFI